VTQARTTLVEVERVLGQGLEEDSIEVEAGPPRILLVDDDEDARLMVRKLLEHDGYQVEEAEDGNRALDVLKNDKEFQLIVLDLAMPGMDGREVLQNVRGSVETAALPVLVRTGTGSNTIETELLEAGADDYVGKSMDPERFMARVRAVLRRSV